MPDRRVLLGIAAGLLMAATASRAADLTGRVVNGTGAPIEGPVRIAVLCFGEESGEWESEDGRDAERIRFGSTLEVDHHARCTFDYQIANPPYGKDWKRDADAVKSEHERGEAGRFAPGLPRISDGQLLFLLHMLLI